METFATGLKRIKELCDAAGCKVEFRAEKDDFVVCFYRNLRDTWNRNRQVTLQENLQENLQQELDSILRTIDADYDILANILEYCQEPHSTKEILEHLHKSDRGNLQTKYLRPLLGLKLLQLTDPSNPIQVVKNKNMLQQKNIKDIKRNTDSQVEQTNYTKWQREHYDGVSPDEFFAATKEYDKANPFTGKAKRI